MASITLKKLPEQLHRDFKQRALANRRSLQAEIIRTLEESVGRAEPGDYLSVDDVAGMLKPEKKRVSVSEMEAAVERESVRRWKGH